MLFACISADVYEMIVDCADYETALSKLKRVYVKSPNAIFARHALATRKQNPEESLHTFLKELLVLSKACNFQDVTAEFYRNELFRDAFINGLKCQEIRQRLLETNELTLDQTFDIANSFDMALKHSASYLSHEKGRSAAAAVTPGDNIYANGTQRRSSSSCTIPTQPKGSFCVKAYHERDRFPARDAICCSCKKRGHFSWACRSRLGSKYSG